MDVVLGLLIAASQEPPEPEAVKAGWVAFGVFLLLVAAIVVLGFSLVKQLRRAERAEQAGVYGTTPTGPDAHGADGDGPDADDGATGPGDSDPPSVDGAPGSDDAAGSGGRSPTS